MISLDQNFCGNLKDLHRHRKVSDSFEISPATSSFTGPELLLTASTEPALTVRHHTQVSTRARATVSRRVLGCACAALWILVWLTRLTAVLAIATATASQQTNPMNIKVTSSAFAEGGMIPKQYTCDGKDVSPPLAWEGVPATAKSIALISDDPDAPMGTWVHWVLFNLPPNTKQLAENIPTKKVLPNGAKQGTNDFGRIGYGGPCPPSGTHRYYFKVYALDCELNLDAGATKAQLLKAMEGHVLAQGQLMGKYKR